jgi:tellurite resistance protein
MTTEADVIRALADLGMDEHSVQALPLLPLVQVAWADGEVQDGERKLIESVAAQKFGLGEEGQRLLNNWLRYPPSPTYLERGKAALLMVAKRGGELDESVLEDVVALSKKVAKSAGGLFGIGSVSASESEALAEIASALKVTAGAPLDTAKKGALSPEFGNSNKVTITFSTSAFDVGALGGVIELEDSEDRIPVTRDGVTVGSDAAADIRVEHDNSVGGLHAQLIERNRKFYVVDLDSEKGTWVNGERVVERRLLGGETVRVGREVSLTFKLLRRIPKQMVD